MNENFVFVLRPSFLALQVVERCRGHFQPNSPFILPPDFILP